MSNVVSPAELYALLGDPSLRVIDARHDLADADAGLHAWRTGHVPGAVHLDLLEDLSGPAGEHGGRHPLPDVAAMTAVFERAGVGDGTRVVVYDQATGMFASRVWWMLRYLGFDNVQVLDGGFAAWSAAGHPVATDGATPAPGSLTARPRPGMLASRDEVLASLGSGRLVLTDARSPARYSGEVAQMDPIPGHIPSALNRYYEDNLVAGRLRPPHELRALHGGLDGDVVAYCGSGVSATMNILAMAEAGLATPRLYVGSWSDWSSWPDAPVAVGSDPE